MTSYFQRLVAGLAEASAVRPPRALFDRVGLDPRDGASDTVPVVRSLGEGSSTAGYDTPRPQGGAVQEALASKSGPAVRPPPEQPPAVVSAQLGPSRALMPVTPPPMVPVVPARSWRPEAPRQAAGVPPKAQPAAEPEVRPDEAQRPAGGSPRVTGTPGVLPPPEPTRAREMAGAPREAPKPATKTFAVPVPARPAPPAHLQPPPEAPARAIAGRPPATAQPRPFLIEIGTVEVRLPTPEPRQTSIRASIPAQPIPRRGLYPFGLRQG